eukprot:3169439-Pyramimonas_sp.AAC.1
MRLEAPRLQELGTWSETKSTPYPDARWQASVLPSPPRWGLSRWERKIAPHRRCIGDAARSSDLIYSDPIEELSTLEGSQIRARNRGSMVKAGGGV